jgi:hypothetical protein
MHEVPLFPLWVTVFLTIWGVVGPIVGLVAGHFLSESAQRKRWVADNQKDEYRKLLAALTKINVALLDLHSGNGDHQDLDNGMNEFSQATNTCLFINDFLEQSKVLDEIKQAVQSFITGGDLKSYQGRYWTAVNQIIASARKISV